MSFVEELLDVGYDYGVVGGPRFNTDIVERGSGYEIRNAIWANARGQWELGERSISHERWLYIDAFFRARRGREVGFRFKDWTDFEATKEPLAPDGSPTVQLRKTYSSDVGDVEIRKIQKPVDGTLSFERENADYTPAGVDTTTGIATLAKDKDLEITNVTASSPTEVTTNTDHGLTSGEEVYPTGTGRSIDETVWKVSVIDSTTVSLDGSDTSGESSSSSGRLEQYVQSSEKLTWSGEFHVPARFDADQINATFQAADMTGPRIHFIASLPVKEIRL